MATQKSNIPVLRFPEFKGEWVQSFLGNISTNAGYGMNSAATEFDGEYKYLRITDIDEETRRFIPNPLSSPSDPVDEKYLLNEGDIVFARTGASVGKSYLYKKDDGKLCFAGFLIRFSILKNNAYFVYCYTLKQSYFKWVQLMSMRSGQPGINAEEYKDLKIYLPKEAEQKKIADFLTAVDQKIAQLTEKKSCLEQYKKGVMQRLFTQRLRFKDSNGNPFPDWEEKKLGDIVLSVKNGLNIDQGSDESGFKVTRIETISDGTINLNKVGYIQTDKDISEYKLQIGDMLFSNINSVSHIGKIAYVDRKCELYHGMNLLNIKIDQNDNSSKFFYYQLTSRNKKNYFERICNQAVSQASINQTDLKKTPVLVPSLPEQQKIADFLTAIDAKITALGNQLTAAQDFKKSLLQKMFV